MPEALPETSTSRPKHLAIAVTFFYREERLDLLRAVTSSFNGFGDRVSIWVVTNRADEVAKGLILDAIGPCDVHVVSPSLLGHPYLLTWSHREIFRKLYDEDSSISHFLYVEDDLKLTTSNIAYWMAAREELRPYGLIPGFVRFEFDKDGERVGSDIYRVHNYFDMARVECAGYSYVNFRYPYQGFYLMDRELMGEFIVASTWSPDSGKWNIREKASQGLIYSGVPKGAFSRSFVKYRLNAGIDEGALFHHVPNTYAGKGSKYGSIRIDELVTTKRLRIKPSVAEWLKVITLRKPRTRKPLVIEGR